ncbi:Uncharacterised protein [Mycobacteroides abscessus subsp. abscessus]|nr:Uncharacterised protein [Mycobacteroides abscessus subsp. abscessus]
MKKFELGSVASAVRTSIGVLLLAASAIPVNAFVNPQP